ncbi:hypothetical protein [Algoriphagus sp.]|uniref:hypothetical protein n=1 Tax=Algoriphagus sp. TaxID=1872435 RepID=UPI0039187A0C
MQKIKNFVEFQKELSSNAHLQQEFKDDPVKAIQQFKLSLPDNWVYRVVVGSLGLAILTVIAGVILLSFSGKTIDATILTLFTAIASGSVGALAGLLSPAHK